MSGAVQERNPSDLQRRVSILGKADTQSRGDRFALRREGTAEAEASPSFADMVNLPNWILCDADMAGDIAAVTALLHFRHAVDRELSGTRLRAICECVGEHNYDLACEAPIPIPELIADTETKMPSPDQLKTVGQMMLDRALPATMASTTVDAAGDINMRHLSNIATALVMSHRSASMDAEA